MVVLKNEYLLPRLTRSMRANTNLEISRKLENQEADLKAIIERRRKLQLGCTWKQVKKIVEEHVSAVQYEKVLPLLTKLWTTANCVFGPQDDARVIDDAALFLLRLFLDPSDMELKSKYLKKRFFTITIAQTKEFARVIQAIQECLTENCITAIGRIDKLKDNAPLPSTFKFVLPQYNKYAKIALLHDMAPVQGSTNRAAIDFSMSWSRDLLPPPIKQPTPEKHDRAWLASQIGADLVENLMALLKSEKLNDELQNDLFDFIGFDKFEVIQEILNNRKTIIAKVSDFDRKCALNSLQLIPKEHKPIVACQVTVQSEQEKQMMKQYRKDEKKLKNLLTVKPNEADEEWSLAKLKTRQQQDILNMTQAAARVNTEQKVVRKVVPRIKYPNVYDSQSEAQNSIGFIAGSKILLPDTVVRRDNKLYEEVLIPAVETLPPGITTKRIDISSLDKIGQIAFHGTKQLNLIQSIVFPTAYKSNENMLVCAPTGAGKTNVAMLTIVHTILSHIEDDVIKRDNFKIVYVAPMKALAAEMVENFGNRLKPLGILVRELTGDMQLTKMEMQQTQMLVTTPEKWDVVTRKGAGDVSLISLVKLLIIDEVHLLHGERGPVVEALVARTLRLVESSQSMIRIVGLSATLPNYIDVAHFLRVNPMVGLFFFDSRFRPVPLQQNFIGVKSIKPMQQMADMDTVCYEKCVEMLKQGHQVMVFVHARNATVKTAMALKELAQQKNELTLFAPNDSTHGSIQRIINRSRNKQLVELLNSGLAIHHAGMLRTDRSMVEKYFGEGVIRVLVCTATLAWGVNLPAHAVIIKGTEIYDSKHGAFIDLGILDVLQIFGRAGRPQFDKSGVGTIITAHDRLNHYLSLLTNQFPIESNFINCLSDNLNAEITLGTICNIDEAIEWLSYTYLFVRMRINPQVYGINYTDVQNDPMLEQKRRSLITTAAIHLDKAKMIRFNQRTGDLNVTELGRTASHFYIKYDTVETFNGELKIVMNEAEILAMMSLAQEFEQLKVRDEEMDELDMLSREYCEMDVKGGSENVHGKVNILMQTYLSRGFVKAASLISDLSYINQNAVRIARALFTIALRNNYAILAGRMLTMSKMFERQMWDFMSPLHQFHIIPHEVMEKIENRGLSIAMIREMDAKELGIMLRHQKYGGIVLKCAEEFPLIELETQLQPITRTVLRIKLQITPSFRWNDKIHGKFAQSFWIWIEDTETNFIYHSEYFHMTRRQVILNDVHELVMTIPLKEPLPTQYLVKVISDSWLGCQMSFPLKFKHLILPEMHPPHTDLLPLQPLPLSVLNDKQFESLYNFSHFNPIQTQIFHCLYHTDNNVLLGAPTGSGKTIAAEVAMFRVFKKYPKGKVVYIAPLKALVRERIEDWKERLQKRLGKMVVELTGDVTPDARAIRESHVIVTTPEKWDGISRSWQTREYVRDVALIVIDEIHLLGEDRGPTLEVIVSRTNFIASHTERSLRIIGLSTALANARDLANWLGIGQMGLYNFKPSVRPVPLSVHIQGFPGKHYCPRMATMNRPTFQAIRQYSPCTPALVFVSSRRQTRLTALDLIAYLAAEDNPKQFLHISDHEMEPILDNIRDTNLKLTLAFGIGLHHAGLHERDRKTCEELFLNRKIQVLVATATLAWGVNLPAHLVVVKGTEFYDGKLKRYVDMPITDVLQMMGRAGRPQFDNEGVAVVMVHDVKKHFYKKFLYEPFPVESSLLGVLPDHINAEIVAGTVQTKQGIIDYLTWTYFFRRLLKNPAFYNLESIDQLDINRYLSTAVQNVLDVLVLAGCVYLDEDERHVYPTSMGRICSFYYLSNLSMAHFADKLNSTMTWSDLLWAMCDAYEFNQQPVRHNEDIHNAELAAECRIKVDPLTYDSPHTKTFLLMQAHFSHLQLPNSDYLTDTKSVLDQAIRVLQAMIDISAERGWLTTTIRAQMLMQCVIQARWYDDPVVLTLPHVEEHNVPLFHKIQLRTYLTLPSLKDECRRNYELMARPLREDFDDKQIEDMHKVLLEMPTIHTEVYIRGPYGQESEIDRLVKQPPSNTDWMDIYAGHEYALHVKLTRLGARGPNRIHCPKFPKGKDEGWFLTLGSREHDELIALKRIGYKGNRSSHQLGFMAPAVLGKVIYTVYLVSDGYLGLDQQYDILLNVTEPRPNAEPSDQFDPSTFKEYSLF